MVKGDLALTIPNPHHKDIARELLTRIFGNLEFLKKNGKIYSPTGRL